MKKVDYRKRLKEILKAIQKYHLLTRLTPENLRLALESLGPTFVKLGQIMADREDMLSEEYCNELRKLRSQVAPMSSLTVKKILKRELKLKYYDFTSIKDSPIGSASIAQVHKARLGNQNVVIKLERENIEDLMEIDIYLLKKILKHLPLKNINIDLHAFLDELLVSAKKEMNFLEEEQNMLEFAKRNEPFVRVPKVIEGYTTHHLLVMEYVDGIKINDVKALNYIGYDVKAIAKKLTANYIKQALEDGFYHADPHPDNLQILDNQIVYLDFGMMGRLDNKNKKIITDCMMNIVLRDYEGLTHTLLLFGTSKPVNERLLEKDLQSLLESYLTTGLGDIDLKEFAPSLISIIQKHHIKIPKEITLLMRGIVVLEGVLEDIYPEMNLLEALKESWHPVINKEKIEQYGLSLLKSVRDMKRIPEEILTTLKTINNGSLQIEMKENKKEQPWVLGLIDVSLLLSCVICSFKATLFTNVLSIGFFIAFVLLTLHILKK